MAADERTIATGRDGAIVIAATWHHHGRPVPAHHDLLRRLVQELGEHGFGNHPVRLPMA